MIRWLSRNVVPPVILATIVGAAWHLAVRAFEIKPFLMPSPLRVIQSLYDNAGPLLSAARFTATAALFGLAVSTIVGVGIAILFSQSSIIRRSCYPYAIYLQTAPIVAIAPLLATWIGEGFTAIVVVVFIISLFPIITNSTDGLLSVPEHLLELFRLHKATRWQTLSQLQIPSAMPRILTGVKISSAMVVLGATIGEYFVGSFSRTDTGLGHVIFKASSLMQTDKLFATTIVCTLLSVLIFYSVSGIGWLLIRWNATDGE
jgi:NitT/TauT family transport system permease protein